MDNLYKVLCIILILGLALALYGFLIRMEWPTLVTMGLSIAIAALGSIIVTTIITNK